eukprot:NODE_429_length_8748_cov_0.280148.p3 type:complete len:388 gc:universal NODE_429_length_8748_cov_0.280148:3178-4341(+)
MTKVAVCLMGGHSKGTRFRPLSLTTPKPFFRVGGHSIPEWIIKSTSFDKIYFIGFYTPDEVNEPLKKLSAKYNIKLEYLMEPEGLGTAGGLLHFQSVILQDNPEQICLLHSDVLCSFPIEDMMLGHKHHLVSILTTQVLESVSTRFGCLVIQEDKLMHYAEKPESYISNWINGGVYIISPKLFKLLPSYHDEDYSLTSPTASPSKLRGLKKLSLERTVLPQLAGSGMVRCYKYDGYWAQLKTANSAIALNTLALHTFNADKPTHQGIIMPCSIHPTAQISPSSKIGPNVSIGPNVYVGDGVRIRDAIIAEQTHIDPYACVMHSVLGKSNFIGKWARVEGSPLSQVEVSFGNLKASNLVGSKVPLSDENNYVVNGVKQQSATILGNPN